MSTDEKLYLSFHFYDGDDNGTPKLGTREIDFDEDGWPYVVSDEAFGFNWAVPFCWSAPRGIALVESIFRRKVNGLYPSARFLIFTAS